MSLEYIRKQYNVPAKRGAQVIADGEFGVITGARGAHLRIRIQGRKMIEHYHPTWRIHYVTTLSPS